MIDTYQLIQQHPMQKFFSFLGGKDVNNDQMLDLLYNQKAVNTTLGTPEMERRLRVLLERYFIERSMIYQTT